MISQTILNGSKAFAYVAAGVANIAIAVSVSKFFWTATKDTKGRSTKPAETISAVA